MTTVSPRAKLVVRRKLPLINLPVWIESTYIAKPDGVGFGVFVLTGVAVGGNGVFVLIGVAVGDNGVLVLIGVAVGGTNVFVGVFVGIGAVPASNVAYRENRAAELVPEGKTASGAP